MDFRDGIKCLKIIVTYFGERRSGNNNFLNKEDCKKFIIESINNEINIDPGVNMDLLIVNNEDGNDESKKFIDQYDGISINRGKIKVVHRPNNNASFGGFNYGYSLSRNEYDYYLFNEDDITLTEPYYFKYAIDHIEKDPSVGFVSFSPISINPRPHSGGGFGVAPKHVLEYIYLQNNSLSFVGENVYGDYEKSEVAFTCAIYNSGYKIENLLNFSALASNYEKHSSQMNGSYHTHENINNKKIYKVGL